MRQTTTSKTTPTGIMTEDTVKEPVEHLIEDRLPWLFVGLLGGIITTFTISKYEALLNADIRLAFFIPLIVYLSDAVGTQTETIYVRVLGQKKVNFAHYIAKETLVGMGLGVVFGLLLGVLATIWLHSLALGITIALTLLINQTLAPMLAVLIPNLLTKSHRDPALGAGPVATIIQDLLSVLIYFVIATIIML